MHVNTTFNVNYKIAIKVKVKAFPYSKPSVGPGADPGVQTVSPQVTVSHPPSGRLPLLSAIPAVKGKERKSIYIAPF